MWNIFHKGSTFTMLNNFHHQIRRFSFCVCALYVSHSKFIRLMRVIAIVLLAIAYCYLHILACAQIPCPYTTFYLLVHDPLSWPLCTWITKMNRISWVNQLFPVCGATLQFTADDPSCSCDILAPTNVKYTVLLKRCYWVTYYI